MLVFKMWRMFDIESLYKDFWVWIKIDYIIGGPCQIKNSFWGSQNFRHCFVVPEIYPPFNISLVKKRRSLWGKHRVFRLECVCLIDCEQEKEKESTINCIMWSRWLSLVVDPKLQTLISYVWFQPMDFCSSPEICEPSLREHNKQASRQALNVNEVVRST